MERQISESELKHVDLGGTETTAEGRENAAWATTMDAIFREEWDKRLREICMQVLRASTDETGLKEACRRAFREGYRAAQDGRGADRPAATPRSTG